MERERHIEKLLRAFAKKRKADAGAPLEMHPATRRLLQGEVVRMAAKTAKKGGSFWSVLFASPQRTFAVCAVASLIVSGLVFLLMPGDKTASMTMVQNKQKVEHPLAGPAAEDARMPMVASAPEPVAPMTAAAPLPEQSVRKDVEEKRVARALSESSPIVVAPAAAPVKPAREQALAKKSSEVDGDRFDMVLNEAARGEMPIMAGFGVAQKEGEGVWTRTPRTGELFFSENGSNTKTLSDDDLAANRQNMTLWNAPVEETNVPLFADFSVMHTNSTLLAYDYKKREATDKLGVEKPAAQRFHRLIESGTGGGGGGGEMTKFKADHAALDVSNSVLDQFAVKQLGDKITIVDGDGSEYSGYVQRGAVRDEATGLPKTMGAIGAASTARRASGTVPTGAIHTMAVSPVPERDYYFRVVGTNRSSKELVVFSGNLLNVTNSLMTNGVGTNWGSIVRGARIEGKATVGGKAAVEVKAQTVSE